MTMFCCGTVQLYTLYRSRTGFDNVYRPAFALFAGWGWRRDTENNQQHDIQVTHSPLTGDRHGTVVPHRHDRTRRRVPRPASVWLLGL